MFAGHHPRGAEVHKYTKLKKGDVCKLTVPPICTAINISTAEWGIHGNHTYYVTIKAENVAGLTTYGVSEPYIHNVQLPSRGVVMDTAVWIITHNRDKEICFRHLKQSQFFSFDPFPLKI